MTGSLPTRHHLSRDAAIKVTDHALVRWLERCCGIDMEFFRRQLAAELQHIAGSGAYTWRTPECTFVFRGDTLVSVLAPSADADWRRRGYARPEDRAPA